MQKLLPMNSVNSVSFNQGYEDSRVRRIIDATAENLHFEFYILVKDQSISAVFDVLLRLTSEFRQQIFAFRGTGRPTIGPSHHLWGAHKRRARLSSEPSFMNWPQV